MSYGSSRLIYLPTYPVRPSLAKKEEEEKERERGVGREPQKKEKKKKATHFLPQRPTMANEQINVPSLILVLVFSGLVLRYLFSTPGGGNQAAAAGDRGGSQSGAGARRVGGGGPVSREREAAVARIQQMFPQVDRRTVLWDLQRNGGNLTATTDRILAGRLETVSFFFFPFFFFSLLLFTCCFDKALLNKTKQNTAAAYYLPASPTSHAAALGRRDGDHTLPRSRRCRRHRGAAGPYHEIQPPRQGRGVVGRGCCRRRQQRQGRQGLELEPRREAGAAAEEAGRHDPRGQEEDGGQDGRREGCRQQLRRISRPAWLMSFLSAP